MRTDPSLHYLDNASTTMVDPAVAEVIHEAMLRHWANPSSLYPPGAESEAALNRARAALARTIGCKSREFYFTSCGSEGNNLALLGGAQTRTFGKKILCSGFEHPSVRRPLEALAKAGWQVEFVPPAADGSFDVDRLLERVDRSTILVACMMVNNETGARCDVEKLARETKALNSRTIVHVDGVQAWMRLPVRLEGSGIDSFVVSGHKIHAPKGVGGLYLSDKLAQSFKPPYLGGEQERGLRPGTENLPYALGLAAAAQKMAPDMAGRTAHIQALKAAAGGAGRVPHRGDQQPGRRGARDFELQREQGQERDHAGLAGRGKRLRLVGVGLRAGRAQPHPAGHGPPGQSGGHRHPGVLLRREHRGGRGRLPRAV